MKPLRSIWYLIDGLFTFLIYLPFCLLMSKLTGELDSPDEDEHS